MPYKRDKEPRAQHRVVVTGLGMITSMGIGAQRNAEGFRTGRSALKTIEVFESGAQRVQRAGEVEFTEPMPDTRLSKSQLRRLDRASRLLLYAGSEALKQTEWTDAQRADALPLCLGTSAAAMSVGEAFYQSKISCPATRRKLAEKVFLYQPTTQARHFQDAFGVQGSVCLITNACASGANAIGHAYRLIQRGDCKRALAGGYDALAHMVFAGFDALQALSTTTPRPFDAHRDGLALGEGAAILALETLEEAQARGATILAEIVGYGTSTDLHHLTQPHPEGDAALRSMNQATREAGLKPSDVQYINSHGTGTPLNDVAEGNAIKRWAGEATPQIMVSSTKASIGHLLGGAGAVETAISILAMQEGFVPPTTTLDEIDPVCEFDLVTAPRDAELTCVLTNSFGFGGANATLILKKGH